MLQWRRRLLAGLLASLVIAAAVPVAGIALLLTVGPHAAVLPQRYAEVAAPILTLILPAIIAGGALKAARTVWRRTSGTRASPD